MKQQSLSIALPNPGQWQEVADDVFWIRMPLPFELDHINLYLLRDGDNFVLVDTGIHTKVTRQLWEQLFETYKITLSKIIVTHMHPDHIGNAGWLCEHFRIPLLMSHMEYFIARSIRAGDQGASHWEDEEHLVRCGLDQQHIERSMANRDGIKHVVSPIPVRFTRLVAGQTLEIDQHKWSVMIGRGHSPEHVCLYDAERKLLISGDHVLPHISPNIGVYSTEPEANALKLYLDTLPQFLKLPEDTLVLPSHKLPFHGLHERVNQLLQHHQEHLTVLLNFCQTERTLVDCLPVMFDRELNHQSMFFAVAECLSHLNYLWFQGSIIRKLREDGVYVYQVAN